MRKVYDRTGSQRLWSRIKGASMSDRSKEFAPNLEVSVATTQSFLRRIHGRHRSVTGLVPHIIKHHGPPYDSEGGCGGQKCGGKMWDHYSVADLFEPPKSPLIRLQVPNQIVSQTDSDQVIIAIEFHLQKHDLSPPIRVILSKYHHR